MMGSATRACSEVSLNLVDSESCVSTPQMQPDTETTLDLQLEDSIMMMPSPAVPVYGNSTLELIQEPENEYGDDSLQTNLDIMYLETFGNMTHATQLAEIAQIEDELKLQQQIEVENEFKNADHLQNGVQLQNMAFNFETENDGLENERRDLFEEIDIDPPPIAIPIELEPIKSNVDAINGEALPPPMSDILNEIKKSERNREIDKQESKLDMRSLEEESEISIQERVEPLENNVIKSTQQGECPPDEMQRHTPIDVKGIKSSENDHDNQCIEQPLNQIKIDHGENIENINSPIIRNISGDEEEEEKTMTKNVNGRILIDIDSMKKVIENRKLNKPYRVPLVPAYLHEGLDEDDELLRAFNARQDESMTCICILCYQWYEDKPALMTHMEEHKKDTVLEKCTTCHKTFFARFLRLRHEKIHKYDMEHPHRMYYPSIDKPFDYFVPNHFYKRFKFAPFTKGYYKKIKDITKEIANVPYECCDCRKVFKGEESVREHYERSHAVQICPICHERLFDVKALRKHEEKEHDLKAVDNNCRGGAWRVWRHWEAEKMEEMKTIISNVDFMHTYAYREDETDELDAKDLIERAIERQLDKKTSFKRPYTVDEGVFQIASKRIKESVQKKSTPQLDKLIPILPQLLPKLQPAATTMTVPMESNSLSNPTICEICQEEFTSSESMLHHVQKSHTNERPYKCQFCGRGFATHSNRKEHERIHTGERPYVCIFCSRGFIQISNLKKHMQTHKDKNNLQCKTCGKQFVKESSLILHQRAHAVDRKFKCAHCDKAYNYSSLLKRHERIHTGEMPYSCDICMMPFHELVSLTYHRKKVHTGERPHKCTTCGRAFILSSDLKKHMKVHWKDNYKEEDGGEISEGSDSDSIDSLLRRELLEDGNNFHKTKSVRSYEGNKRTASEDIKSKFRNEETNNITDDGTDPAADLYEVFLEDELQEINDRDSKNNHQSHKSVSSNKTDETEINSNDNERDTTVVWLENGQDSDDKYIVVDNDGNEIGGDSVDICDVFD